MLPQEFNPLETMLKASVCKTENQQDQDQADVPLWHASEAEVGRSPPLWHASEAEPVPAQEDSPLLRGSEAQEALRAWGGGGGSGSFAGAAAFSCIFIHMGVLFVGITSGAAGLLERPDAFSSAFLTRTALISALFDHLASLLGFSDSLKPCSGWTM